MDNQHDKEILQRLLAAVLGERRPDELAAALMDQFGSIPSLVESMPMHRDLPPVSDNIRMLLSMVPQLTSRCFLEQMGPHPRLNTLKEASRYASALYIGVQYERIILLCLDKDYRLLDHCVSGEGGLREVPFYPRRLLQDALKTGSAALILCHNHPSGWAFFSEADVNATRELLSLCAKIQLPILDHLLIANDHVSSMRSSAFIPDRQWRACGPMTPPLGVWRAP